MTVSRHYCSLNFLINLISVLQYCLHIRYLYFETLTNYYYTYFYCEIVSKLGFLPQAHTQTPTDHSITAHRFFGWKISSR